MRPVTLGLLLQGIGLVPVLAFVVTGQTSSVSVWYACTVIGLAGAALMLVGLVLDIVSHARTVRGGR